ncbi:MAG: tetratricopeptide repeat protein [Cryomorphaceae bacterium]|nr:tetratricopeptide repeat protein [Cryomorphaceae bacterium]
MEKRIGQYIILLILALAPLVSFGQTDDELADYYYANGQYEQARLYYEKIWKNNRTNKVYENYLNTLIALEDLEEAEKLIKKKIRGSADAANAHVDLASLYLQFNEDERAKDEFEEALKELQPGRSNATRLANAYIKLNAFDYAMKTYEKGKRISTDGYEYHYEIANLQGMMGDFENMTESFLDLLRISPSYIQTVQNSLNRNLNFLENEDTGEMLRGKLLKRVQRYPDDIIYSEMLIWLFNQQKDFGAALVQAKAIDKRLDESGIRVLEIGNMARNNEDYDVAIDAYNYVVAKGTAGMYYASARGEMLKAKLTRMESRVKPEESEVRELAAEYTASINDLGNDLGTVSMMQQLAHIKAFYLNDAKGAIDILNKALEVPGVYDRSEASCKLELADILVLEGDIWEASLLYSQVELTFKEDPIGHDAKFRNARIAYYSGDFEWAQAQLDVLKASTSKLISNDAIDLSLLITDNFNMDTTTVPMRLFAQADLLAYQNRIPEAEAKLDSLLSVWPRHTLKDEILMLRSDIYMKQGRFADSEKCLEEILTVHFKDILADDALFRLAEMNDEIYKNEDKAKELYQRLLVEYPGSLYVVEARKRFRALRGDEIE